MDTCLQPPDLGQHFLSFDDWIFSIAPAGGNRPFSFFKVPKIEATACPVLFPDGTNMFDDPDRPILLSPSRYFNKQWFFVNNQFAQETNYIFFQCSDS